MIYVSISRNNIGFVSFWKINAVQTHIQIVCVEGELFPLIYADYFICRGFEVSVVEPLKQWACMEYCLWCLLSYP